MINEKDSKTDFNNIESINKNSIINVWDNAEAIAEEFYYGIGFDFEDHENALEKYIEAYYLGSPTAPFKIGRIYMDDNCVKSDNDLAIKYFKLGIERSDDRCLVPLGSLYVDTNIEKCIELFSDYLKSDGIKTKLHHSDVDVEINVSTIFHTIFLHKKENSHDDIMDKDFLDIYNLLTPYKSYIINNITHDIEYLNKGEDDSLIEIYENRLGYLIKE